MKTVLFETHHLYYWSNFLPIIEELTYRENYKIYVSMPCRVSKIQEQILNNFCSEISIKFLSANTEKERIKKIVKHSFDIIIVGNIGQLNKIAVQKTIAVMVYHGIGLKKSYYKDIDDRINIRAVESLNRFNELKNHGHKNLILTGFTKLDRLHTIKDHEIRLCSDYLNLNPNKKTVLYAPSFYPTSIEKICPYLPELSQDYNIIIKLHGFSWEQKRFRYQSELCNKLSKENEGIELIDNKNIDIIPFYKISDVLITDISSTMFEYLPLNRPIIQAECYTLRLKHKIFKSRYWEKMDLNRQQDVDFSYKIINPSDLLGRVYFALDNLDAMSDQRIDAFKNYLYKNDGKASSRLVDAIEKF